ncbi:hypothetical protein BG74_06280 [Sodalis-like endosymbiont of Proechinophthirus fluctus]|nr:hypothetical protein BG74_06280 [Sodalis-like endosymbiont of Proechinophthirus fluctus]
MTATVRIVGLAHTAIISVKSRHSEGSIPVRHTFIRAELGESADNTVDFIQYQKTGTTGFLQTTTAVQTNNYNEDYRPSLLISADSKTCAQTHRCIVKQ